MNEENLINYYNKFNEDKRLNSRHGQVEFFVTMEYIKKYLSKMKNPKIVDIGAGCGKYSIELANMGYSVDAVELVKHNLRVIEKKSSKVKTHLGNAKDLSIFKDNTFDIALLFGPMYHLVSEKDKIKALEETKRIVKRNGIIMVAYCMNDYAVMKHGFIDKNIIDCVRDKMLNKDFKVEPYDNQLYSYVRMEDINKLNEKVGLKRLKIISPDGPSDYIRRTLNSMSEEEFKLFKEYQLSVCERYELIGAGAHTVDILKK